MLATNLIYETLLSIKMKKNTCLLCLISVLLLISCGINKKNKKAVILKIFKHFKVSVFNLITLKTGEYLKQKGLKTIFLSE